MVVTFILTLLVGVLLGMALMYCIMSARRTGMYTATYNDFSNNPPILADVQQSAAVAGSLNEELSPPPVEIEIELKSNQTSGSAS